MMGHELIQKADGLAKPVAELSRQADVLLAQAPQVSLQVAAGGGVDTFIFMFTIFVLAVFVGFYVVWNVTSALHSPLMSVTNAISSVIIVGALIAAGPMEVHFSKIMGFIAVVLASINIFGGFVVSQRMLQMFRKKG